MKVNRTLSVLAAIVTLIVAGPGLGRSARAGSTTYFVTVDTSSDSTGLGLNGTLGALEFQLNPGNSGSPLTTAAITGFASDGTPGTGALGPVTFGDVTGVLPGTVFMDNGSGFADYFHPFTYGSFLSFYLTLSLPIPNPGAATGTTFSFLMYSDPYGNNSIPAGGGPAFTINVDPAAGPGQPQQYIPPPTLIIGQGSVPEPSSVVLLGVALAGSAGWACRRRGR